MKHCKLIAFLLASLFVFYAIPTNIYAEFKADEETLEAVKEQESTYTYGTVNEAGELVLLRDANTKHYRTADGAFIAQHYPRAVHIQRENGTWEEINNALSSTIFGTYKNEDARIRFAKRIGNLSGLFVLNNAKTKIAINSPTNFHE